MNSHSKKIFQSYFSGHHIYCSNPAIDCHLQYSGYLIQKNRCRFLTLPVFINRWTCKGRRRLHFPEAIALTLMFVAVLIIVRVHSTNIVGGSDSYGYISASLRLSQGKIWQPERVFSLFGLDEDSRISHPLGEKEKGSLGTVPSYPLGYPLLMALFICVFSLEGAFWVTPLLSAGTVVLTYLLGRAFFGRIGGVFAAALVFVLPNFMWSSFQPLSDIPATFFTVFVLFVMVGLRPRTWTDVLAGVVAGYAVWIRPNMMLLILPIVTWLLFHRQWKRFLRFTTAVVPFLVVQGFINTILYGAPWKTGYGFPALGDSLAGAASRTCGYLMNLNMQQASVGFPLVVLGFLLAHLRWEHKALLGGISCIFLVFFAFYRIGDAWWYGRFLLPAFPAVVIIETGLLLRFVKSGRLILFRFCAVIAGLLVFIWLSLGYAQRNNTFTIAKHEARYPKAAMMVLKHIQRPAIVVAVQHSGSVRFYTGLPTTRYNIFSISNLLVRLRQIETSAGNIYLLAEPWEVERIRKGKAAPLLVGAEMLAQVEPNQVTLFRLFPSTSAK